LKGGKGRDLVEVGGRDLIEVGLHERRISFVRLAFFRLSVSAPRVQRAVALVLRSMIALVGVDGSWHPRAWPSQA